MTRKSFGQQRGPHNIYLKIKKGRFAFGHFCEEMKEKKKILQYSFNAKYRYSFKNKPLLTSKRVKKYAIPAVHC